MTYIAPKSIKESGRVGGHNDLARFLRCRRQVAWSSPHVSSWRGGWCTQCLHLCQPGLAITAEDRRYNKACSTFVLQAGDLGCFKYPTCSKRYISKVWYRKHFNRCPSPPGWLWANWNWNLQKICVSVDTVHSRPRLQSASSFQERRLHDITGTLASNSFVGLHYGTVSHLAWTHGTITNTVRCCSAVLVALLKVSEVTHLWKWTKILTRFEKNHNDMPFLLHLCRSHNPMNVKIKCRYNSNIIDYSYLEFRMAQH